MKPVYISVDLEFTTGDDLLGGRVMQIGAATGSGETWKATLPVSTRAVTNAWVRSNLDALLHECWSLDSASSHVPPMHRGDRRVDASFFASMAALVEWVRAVQHAHLMPKKTDPRNS